MTTPTMEAVKSFFSQNYESVMKRLRFDVNVKYLYHDSRHTEDVIRQCQEIAYREGVSQDEIALLNSMGLHARVVRLVEK